MSVPYPLVFIPFDILTAEELNQLVENDVALADGTAIDAGAITTSTLAESAVTASKIDWSTLNSLPAFPGSVGVSSEVLLRGQYYNGQQLYCRSFHGGNFGNGTTATQVLSFTNAQIVKVEVRTDNSVAMHPYGSYASSFDVYFTVITTSGVTLNKYSADDRTSFTCRGFIYYTK